MVNCKYCGKFIDVESELVSANDVVGFLEIQDREFYHIECMYKYYAKLLIQATDNGISMSSRTIQEQWHLTKNEASQVIYYAFELAKTTPYKRN